MSASWFFRKNDCLPNLLTDVPNLGFKIFEYVICRVRTNRVRPEVRLSHLKCRTGSNCLNCFLKRNKLSLLHLINKQSKTSTKRPDQTSRVKRSGLAGFGRVHFTQQIRKISILVHFTQWFTQVWTSHKPRVMNILRILVHSPFLYELLFRHSFVTTELST